MTSHHFYPVISYRRVQTRNKATNYCIRSLVTVRELNRQREGVDVEAQRLYLRYVTILYYTIHSTLYFNHR